ncbi:hypothetical protein L195_g046491, partial [Trifolium pratense]
RYGVSVQLKFWLLYTFGQLAVLLSALVHFLSLLPPSVPAAAGYHQRLIK